MATRPGSDESFCTLCCTTPHTMHASDKIIQGWTRTRVRWVCSGRRQPLSALPLEHALALHLAVPTLRLQFCDKLFTQPELLRYRVVSCGLDLLIRNWNAAGQWRYRNCILLSEKYHYCSEWSGMCCARVCAAVHYLRSLNATQQELEPVLLGMHPKLERCVRCATALPVWVLVVLLSGS